MGSRVTVIGGEVPLLPDLSAFGLDSESKPMASADNEATPESDSAGRSAIALAPYEPIRTKRTP